MLTIGRLCIKTAGRDAMQHCVVIEEVDDKFVLVDGNTRRKNVNRAHLEPLTKTLDVKKGASTKDVLAAFEKAGIVVKKAVEAKKRTAPKAQVVKSNSKQTDKKDSKKSKKE